ncbi:hypothetical protein [Desulfosarcina ovata]|uniref:Uncharacterized protein n=1 Tax=Desulfosarcina ovata subsp. ovata TaxID=2752305 RepID=A0A5K8ALU3_9BACT|nr:hypothetical protein [Desulfosarcina ovata]BBO92800.1 hypothetical protein DSCOOX_59800 [Desulfosarcina ovata subsp. ovata]
MILQYTNRKGKRYFLHEGKTKKGNSRYTFSQSDKNALTIIPDGYEIYENPNAQVFLRRIQPKLINEKEVVLVQERLDDLIQKKYCKITFEKNTIIIYLADQHVNRVREVIKSSPKAENEGVEAVINQIITYSPVIQFVLSSENDRLFILKRVYYQEGERFWELAENPDSLKSLLSVARKEIDIETYYDHFQF